MGQPNIYIYRSPLGKPLDPELNLESQPLQWIWTSVARGGAAVASIVIIAFEIISATISWPYTGSEHLSGPWEQETWQSDQDTAEAWLGLGPEHGSPPLWPWPQGRRIPVWLAQAQASALSWALVWCVTCSQDGTGIIATILLAACHVQLLSWAVLFVFVMLHTVLFKCTVLTVHSLYDTVF